MTTLLIARSITSKPERRCDAKCYSAKGQKCTCICGGINHGVGFDKALENTFDPTVWAGVPREGFQYFVIPFQLLLFHGDSK